MPIYALTGDVNFNSRTRRDRMREQVAADAVARGFYPPPEPFNGYEPGAVDNPDAARFGFRFCYFSTDHAAVEAAQRDLFVAFDTNAYDGTCSTTLVSM